jgi:hypothetical protein
MNFLKVIPYRCYRLTVLQRSNGWKVALYRSDGFPAEPSFSPTTIFTSQEVASAEGKRLIDEFYQSLSVLKIWPEHQPES